jgi:hypothetical protein
MFPEYWVGVSCCRISPALFQSGHRRKAHRLDQRKLTVRHQLALPYPEPSKSALLTSFNMISRLDTPVSSIRPNPADRERGLPIPAVDKTLPPTSICYTYHPDNGILPISATEWCRLVAMWLPGPGDVTSRLHIGSLVMNELFLPLY